MRAIAWGGSSSAGVSAMTDTSSTASSTPGSTRSRIRSPSSSAVRSAATAIDRSRRVGGIALTAR